MEGCVVARGEELPGFDARVVPLRLLPAPGEQYLAVDAYTLQLLRV